MRLGLTYWGWCIMSGYWSEDTVVKTLVLRLWGKDTSVGALGLGVSQIIEIKITGPVKAPGQNTSVESLG